MAQMIKPGKYKANILDYGIGQTKSGDPQVMIQLNYQDSDQDVHEITWFGSLKEGKAQEITIETLLRCGMKGNDVAAVAGGIESDTLDVAPQYTIAITPHEYQGKTSMRVAWISNGGAGLAEKKISKQEAATKLGALNLKGAVAKMRSDTGMKDEPRKAPAPAAPLDDLDDVFGPQTPSFGPM